MEWPPSPGRLFQALVASAAKGSAIEHEDREALIWLEDCDPPIVAAPVAQGGQSFSHFMPNNNLDAEGGDPNRIANVRTASKQYRPLLFDAATSVLYIWSYNDDKGKPERICEVAKQLYQLGRGVDMAWARATILSEEEASECLRTYPGVIHRPAGEARKTGLPCPMQGTLQSLIQRYQAASQRFQTLTESAPTKNEPNRIKVTGQSFAQPPKPRLRLIAYGCTPDRFLFELRTGLREAGFFPWSLRKVVQLMETVRNKAASVLEKQYKDKCSCNQTVVKRVFGLCRDATEADKAHRIHIIPLPSIGHPHADQVIRRLLVEVPPSCPLPTEDVLWAFSSVFEFDANTGQIDWMLVRSDEDTMSGHYGIGKANGAGFRVWRSVTPLALPISRPRGRLKGTERAATERQAAAAVLQALRHAGVAQQVKSVRAQREPFDVKGLMAQDFAARSRFDTRRLWHVEIEFANLLQGPVVIGNGRYVGLGLMRPVKQIEGVIVFRIADGLVHDADTLTVTRALRRAVMARVQDKLGKRAQLPVFFTGHEPNGEPARRGYRSHLGYVFDARFQRLLVLAPHVIEHREPSPKEREHVTTLALALADLKDLRAGAAGKLALVPTMLDPGSDPIFVSSETWSTQASYCPTRHSKDGSRDQWVANDVRQELERRRLPKPSSVQVISMSKRARGGLCANISLTFSVSVQGPILLGQTAGLGGGLFVAKV